MNLLLDECVDHRFASEIQGHTIFTVTGVGWAGVKNGELLSRSKERFDALITVDKRMPEHYDKRSVPLPVVILVARSIQLKHLRPLIPSLHKLLEKKLENGFHVLET